MKIISGKEARALGLKRYFTGKTCPKGHSCERLVSNWTCCVCNRLHVQKKKRDGKGYAIRARARHRQSKHENLAHHSSLARNRRARMLKVGGVHTKDDIDRLFKGQKGKCWCGVSLKRGYHVDHVTPISRGGSNWPSNLQLLCVPCNLSKGSRTMGEWIALVS